MYDRLYRLQSGIPLVLLLLLLPLHVQVWSAEGLLYYLEPSSVAPMLKVRCCWWAAVLLTVQCSAVLQPTKPHIVLHVHKGSSVSGQGKPICEPGSVPHTVQALWSKACCSSCPSLHRLACLQPFVIIVHLAALLGSAG